MSKKQLELGMCFDLEKKMNLYTHTTLWITIGGRVPFLFLAYPCKVASPFVALHFYNFNFTLLVFLGQS